MPVYAIWNNKGGVGKSYLTFQIASEYARIHPDTKVLVVDLCPQANASAMLLGGMVDGETHLDAIHTQVHRRTIAGYIEERVLSPYISPKKGADYITQVSMYNPNVPSNVYLVVGDEQLEIKASKIRLAMSAGPDDAWRKVHMWVSDLISDVKERLGRNCCVLLDCNPSFSVYTELALTAAERLLIPFSADGASKRAVKALLSLVYGQTRHPGEESSEFYRASMANSMRLPLIYMYVGNRLTQMNSSSATAYKTVVNEIGDEIWSVWQKSPNSFCIHPGDATAPTSKRAFKQMFQYEVNDANTASVVSGALGIPISVLTAGKKNVAGKPTRVNQSQLDKQVPNIQGLVRCIE